MFSESRVDHCRAYAVICAGIVVGLISGCGSDTSKDSAATPALSGGAVSMNVNGGTPATDSSNPNTMNANSDASNQTDSGMGTDNVPASLKAPFETADPGSDPSCPMNTLTTVRGWVADENGQPLSGAKAQVCIKQGDMTQCLQPVDSGEDGAFTLELADFRCVNEAAMRIILPRSSRTAMYCEIPMDSRDGTRITITDPMLLYPTVPAAEIPEEGDGLTEKTIKFADGIELDLVPLNGPGYSDLGSTTIPGSTPGLCFLEGQKTPARLYGFSPDGGIYDGGSNFRLPNPDNFPEGKKVELHVLGGLGCTDASGATLQEGLWHKIGTATTTPDGIMPDDGLKLTCLTWLGITPID